MTLPMTADALAIDALIRHELPRARQGDRAAFGRIVTACQNTVTAIALAITRDVPASEDIAQDAFVSAWQHLQRLQNPDSFLPWLRQITRNLARDHLRAARHRPLDGEGAELAIQLAADPAPGPGEALVLDERERAASELIASLPDESREVLLLFYREDQSSRQVASLLGLSDAAVRKRLSRARQALREDLLARFGEFASRTAPGAAFTAIVATALATAAPPAAASAIFTAAAGGGAKTLGKVALGAAGSIAVGVIAGLAGIWLGILRPMRSAIDDEERRGFMRYGVIGSIAVVLFTVALVLAGTFDDGWMLAVAATLAFMGVILYQTMVALPRVLARRHAMEAQRDAVAAQLRRNRERRHRWIGIVLGVGSGLAALVYGLIAAGRI